MNYIQIESIFKKHQHCNLKGNTWFEQFRFTDCKVMIIQDILALSKGKVKKSGPQKELKPILEKLKKLSKPVYN